MARKEAPVLGIDLTDHEIRVVEVTMKAGKPCVTKAGCAEMPGGSMASGRMLNPSAVSIALRRLLDGLGTTADRAVYALQNSQSPFRQITLPPAPDSELDSMVDVEVEHVRFVTPGSPYGAIKAVPPPGADRHDSSTVFCFGGEPDEISAIRDLSSRAGLKVLAVEPASLSELRTAILAQCNAPAMFHLAIGNTTTDAAFLVGGQLIAYRRLDIGESALIEAFSGQIAYGSQASDRYVWNDPNVARPLAPSAVTELGLEVRRTLDYLAREYPEIAVFDKVSITYTSPEIGALAPLLGDKINIPFFNLVPPTGSHDSTDALVELSGTSGSRYAVAYGLAMYAVPQPSVQVRRLDLYNRERTAVRNEESKRNFAGSIVVTVAAIAFTMMALYIYGQQINSVNLDSQKTASLTATIKAETSKMALDRANHINQYKALRKEGIPVGPLMDSIVANLAPGVSLSSLGVGADLKMTIHGDALDERALLQTVENLKRTPLIKDLNITSFKQAPEDVADAINFELLGVTIASNRVRLEPLKVTGTAAALLMRPHVNASSVREEASGPIVSITRSPAFAPTPPIRLAQKQTTPVHLVQTKDATVVARERPSGITFVKPRLMKHTEPAAIALSVRHPALGAALTHLRGRSGTKYGYRSRHTRSSRHFKRFAQTSSLQYATMFRLITGQHRAYRAVRRHHRGTYHRFGRPAGRVASRALLRRAYVIRSLHSGSHRLSRSAVSYSSMFRLITGAHRVYRMAGHRHRGLHHRGIKVPAGHVTALGPKVASSRSSRDWQGNKRPNDDVSMTWRSASR